MQGVALSRPASTASPPSVGHFCVAAMWEGHLLRRPPPPTPRQQGARKATTPTPSDDELLAAPRSKHVLRAWTPYPRRPEAASSHPAASITSTRRAQATAAVEAGLGLGLATLDAVDLQATCRQRVLTLQTAPARVRGSLRTALQTGLRLTVHPSCMMMRYAVSNFSASRPSSHCRARQALRSFPSCGRWADLLCEATAAVAATPSCRPDAAGEAVRARRATPPVDLGELPPPAAP